MLIFLYILIYYVIFTNIHFMPCSCVFYCKCSSSLISTSRFLMPILQENFPFVQKSSRTLVRDNWTIHPTDHVVIVYLKGHWLHFCISEAFWDIRKHTCLLACWEVQSMLDWVSGIWCWLIISVTLIRRLKQAVEVWENVTMLQKHKHFSSMKNVFCCSNPIHIIFTHTL